MSSNSNTIEKLDSGNYLNWKLRIKLILTKEDHWDIVNGDELHPSLKGNEKEGESSKTSEALAAWVKKD